jgi:hypothetical protein
MSEAALSKGKSALLIGQGALSACRYVGTCYYGRYVLYIHRSDHAEHPRPFCSNAQSGTEYPHYRFGPELTVFRNVVTLSLQMVVWVRS